MTRSLILIFNHELTEPQRRDAELNLGICRFVDLPGHLKAIWRQIPPDLGDIGDAIAPVTDWMRTVAQSGDFVLIQGDFGAVYQLVNAALDNGLVPVYATTARQAVERHRADGTVALTHCFKHVRYRKYVR